MSWLVLAVLLQVADPAVVRPGETLAQLAQRLIGDPAAAGELRALNPGVKEAPAAGTHLKIPGPERSLAVSALSAAQHAVDQSGPGAERDKAAGQLARARTLFSQARYPEAANAADSAWRLLNKAHDASARFAVDVARDGTTQVSARSGPAIRVEAEGRMVPVASGETVRVRKGEAPEFAPPPPQLMEPLARPQLLAPDDHDTLGFKSAGALGPVRLSWTEVKGARSYEVRVSSAAGGQDRVLTTRRPTAMLRALQPGTYVWTVKALGPTNESPLSDKRTFELSREGLKLEVHETQWK